MNRHQVITGAANNSENSVAIGSVENNHFTAYGSGGNLIILSSNFDRVQIISSKSVSNNSNDVLKCIDCTLDTGKIAAAYGTRVYIFEPTPSAKKPSHNIRYKWVKVGVIEFESEIVCISWNNDGARLLVGCARGTIQMWLYDPNSTASATATTTASSQMPVTPSPPTTTTKSNDVRFSIYSGGGGGGGGSSGGVTSGDEATTTTDNKRDLFSTTTTTMTYMFKKIWQTK